MDRITDRLGDVLKRSELIERAMRGELKWVEVAEVLRLTPRQVRRLRARFEALGAQGLIDYRSRFRPPNTKPPELIERVVALYREEFFGWNVAHFHEKLTEEYNIDASYPWVLKQLRSAGLVAHKLKPGPPKERRARRPMPGMLLQIDGSDHAWLGEEYGHFSLIGIIDDATNEVYAARFAPQENLWSVFSVIRETVEKKGIFCSLYADRASHFFFTPKAGGKVDLQRRTQCQRAMEQLGVEMIPSYSPEGRGRIERLWSTLQGRLPQELKRAGVSDLNQADRYLQEVFLPHYNRKFARTPLQSGSAFVALHPQFNLDHVFAVKTKRKVRFDNTVSYKTAVLQIPASELRTSYAQCEVTVLEHANNTLSIVYGPHTLARYDLQGRLLCAEKRKKTGT